MSIVSLPIYLYAFLSVRNKNALYLLFFAYIYLIDTMIDIGFTITFCVKWFAHARKASKAIENISTTTTAATQTAIATATTVATNTLATTSSAISQATNTAIEKVVQIASTATAKGDFSIATAAPESLIKRAAVAVSVAAEAAVTATPAEKSTPTNQSASVARESIVTIILTVFLLLVRIYFTFVLIGYARHIVRQQNLRKYNGVPKNSWTSKFQQILLTPFESFWTGFSSRSSNYSPLMNGSRSRSGPNRRHFPTASVASDTGLLGHDNFHEEEEIDLENGGSIGGLGPAISLSSPTSSISSSSSSRMAL